MNGDKLISALKERLKCSSDLELSIRLDVTQITIGRWKTLDNISEKFILSFIKKLVTSKDELKNRAIF